MFDKSLKLITGRPVYTKTMSSLKEEISRNITKNPIKWQKLEQLDKEYAIFFNLNTFLIMTGEKIDKTESVLAQMPILKWYISILQFMSFHVIKGKKYNFFP